MIYTWPKAEAIRDFFPSETKTANSITLSGFLHLNTIDIWGQIILCCGGLSCALYWPSPVSPLSPTAATTKNVSKKSPLVENQGLENDHSNCKMLHQKLNREILINEKSKKETNYSYITNRNATPWTLFADACEKWSEVRPWEEHLRVRVTWASQMSASDKSQSTQSIFVSEAAWSSNLLRSDWMALWLLYSSVHLNSFMQGFLTTLITQQSSQLYQAG